MFMTAVALFELEAFPDEGSLKRECPQDRRLEDLAAEVQWLFPGFTDADLQAATEPAVMIKDIHQIEQLRNERLTRARSAAKL